jgi:hypothetical protein
MTTKEEMKAVILKRLGKAYKKGSGPYRSVEKFLTKKLSMPEIGALYMMVLTSVEEE